MKTATAEIYGCIHPNTGEIRRKALVLDGPHAGTGFLLYNPRAASMGARVTISFHPDDQFATIVEHRSVEQRGDLNMASDLVTRGLVRVSDDGTVVGRGRAWEVHSVAVSGRGLALYGFNHYSGTLFIWYFSMPGTTMSQEYDWSGAAVHDDARRWLALVFPACPLLAAA